MKKLLLYLLLLTSYNLSAQTNNYSLEFDGNNDFIDFGNPSSLQISSEITYMAWVKSYQYSNWSGIVGRGEGTSSPSAAASMLMITSTGAVQWEISDGVNPKDQLVSSYILQLDTLYHVAVTWDGTNSSSSMKIFIDGVLQETGAATISSINPSVSHSEDNIFKIGLRDVISSGSLYGHHNGIINDVSAWNVALTQGQIQQYMNCPPTGNEPGLVGYWNFEEGSGTNTADQTSNGNVGTLNGGVTWSTDAPPYNCCTENPITSQPTDQTVNMGNDATFSFTDTLSGATYQWQMDAGTGYSDLSNAGQFSGSDTKTLTITSATMSNNNTLYRCIVTESASCMDTTDVSTLTVIDNTSITELNNSLVKLFPNPSNGIITITLSQHSNGQIILTDILGKEVLSKSFTSNEVQLNLKSLESKGTYFAKVLDSDGNVIAIKKLIYQ